MSTLDGWLIAWGLAMSLIALGDSLLAILEVRARQAKEELLQASSQRIHELILEHLDERQAWDAKDAQYREDLTEAKSTIELHKLDIAALQKSADHATVPLAEAVTPLSYAETKPIIERAAQPRPPKRPGRGKITGES
jgi:hypothetical protein